jgi:carboxylesterase type B
MESNPLALPYKTTAEATELGTCFQALLGCESGGLECMRGKSAADIVTAQSDPVLIVNALFSGLSGFLLWAPSLDGTLVTQQPIDGISAGLPKPTLLGTNLNEGTLFVYSALKALDLTTLPAAVYHEILVALFGAANTANIEQLYPPVMAGDNAPMLDQVVTDYLFFCATRHFAAAGVSPVYAYEFRQLSNFNVWPDIPECSEQVCHAAELPYVFHSASNIGATFTPAEEMLSQAMVAYWGAFSREGSDPNNGGQTRPAWPAFAGFNYLVLGTPISTAVDPPHNCSLWDGIGYEVLNFADLTTTSTPCVP